MRCAGVDHRHCQCLQGISNLDALPLMVGTCTEDMPYATLCDGDHCNTSNRYAHVPMCCVGVKQGPATLLSLGACVPCSCEDSAVGYCSVHFINSILSHALHVLKY